MSQQSISRRSLLASSAATCGALVSGMVPGLKKHAAAQEVTNARLHPDQLLQYRNDNGQVMPVRSPEDWHIRRQQILEGMQQVMGPLPGMDRKVELNLQVLEEVELPGYIRQLITYQTDRDCQTPAYLCIPKAKEKAEASQKFPAVLCLHPTDNKVGHQVVLGLGGRPGRQYAAELAARGFVTLSPAYPHLANYWPNLGKLGYVSGTMKAIWDNIRGIDLLESFDFVETSGGFGAIGHSLGGHNAIYTAVFEPRITAIASSCGFDSYRDYYDAAERVWFFGKGWCQIRYMPRMSNYRGRLGEIPFDFPELLGALAPRPLYVNAPLHDSNFRWHSVDRCAAAARPIYELLGNADGITVDHPDIDHNFPEQQRERAYEIIQKVIQKKR